MSRSILQLIHDGFDGLLPADYKVCIDILERDNASLRAEIKRLSGLILRNTDPMDATPNDSVQLNAIFQAASAAGGKP